MSKRNVLISVVLGIVAVGAIMAVVYKSRVSGLPDRSVAPGPQTEVKIGWLGPLTGDAAPYGVAIKRGTELALNAVNLARAGHSTLTVLYEDDQAKPQIAASAFLKLTTVDKVPVVIQAAASSVMLALMPKAEQARVVYISPSCSSDTIRAEKVKNNYRFIFRTWPSDAYQAELLAETAFNKLRAKRAAVLYINTDYGVSFRETFTQRFRQLGGEVVLSEGFNEGTTDFRSLINKTKTATPDVVFLPAHYKEASQLLRQAKEMAYAVQFLADAALYSPELLKAAGNAAEGLILTNPDWSADSANPKIKDFVDSFRRRYGEAPDVYAAAGYDLVFVLDRAIPSNGPVSAEAVRTGLAQMDAYEGVTGRIQFDTVGEVRWGFSTFQVSGDRFVPWGQGK